MKLTIFIKIKFLSILYLLFKYKNQQIRGDLNLFFH